MKFRYGLSCSLLALLLFYNLSLAQIPRLLSYQGILTDTTGASKPDGNYDLTFRLYDTETDGSALWTESKTLAVKHSLFSTQLGDVVPLGATVKFDKPYWLSIQVGSQPELLPRIALSAVAYSLNASQSDSARIAGTVPNNSITGAKIANGTIQLADLAQNGAADGQVLKWSSGAWTAAADEVGTGGTAGGWTDFGTTVRLSSISDTVALNTSSRLGKLNLSGDVGLNGESSLFFGSTNSYLGATPGENLTLRANNDLKLYSAGTLTALAADNINLGHLGDASWFKMDNTTKRVGIGMGATDAIDDRLHVKNDLASGCWLRIEGAHPTSWGQTGLRIKTPQNAWHLRMDLSTNANFPDGALSLYSSGNSFETMTWLKDGKVGVGTKNPVRKLHVNGSAEVEDTLYVGTINAGKIVNGPGVVHANRGGEVKLPTTTVSVFDSITIRTPGPGYVLVIFSGFLWSSHDYDDQTFVHVHISTTGDISGKLATAFWSEADHAPAGVYGSPVAMQAIAAVGSAAAYKYYVVVERLSPLVGGYDDVYMCYGSYSALYIPASYGTVESAPPPPTNASEIAVRTGKTQNTQESFESRLNALTAELEALKRDRAASGQ